MQPHGTTRCSRRRGVERDHLACLPTTTSTARPPGELGHHHGVFPGQRRAAGGRGVHHFPLEKPRVGVPACGGDVQRLALGVRAERVELEHMFRTNAVAVVSSPAAQPRLDEHDGIPHHHRVHRVQTWTTSAASSRVLTHIRDLLDDAFAGEFSDDDWEHSLGGWHVVVTEPDTILAHAAVVPRSIEIDGEPFRAGYVEGVATAPGRHGEGLGSLAMSQIMQVLRREFEFGALSTSRHDFYARLGWERWRGPTFVRHGRELVRSWDEDDAVMVLRYGPSLSVDLTASISCDARTGDDW